MQNSTTHEDGHIDAARSKARIYREKLDTLAKGFLSSGQVLFEEITPPNMNPMEYSNYCDEAVRLLQQKGFTYQNAAAAVQTAIALGDLYKSFPNLAED